MCGIFGVMDKRRQLMDGSGIQQALSMMNERGSGEGAGYAAYGIYPDYQNCYALHVFFDNAPESKAVVDATLERWGTVEHDEAIPTYNQPNLRATSTPWRYFFRPDTSLAPDSASPEKDLITSLVMQINTGSNGARVISSGKNVGVFKAVGWPEDVANFYRIEDYEGYIWLAHNRYATKDPGKWERPDPFNLHDWSVAEDGKITSYGTNRRYIESFGYACSMSTDSEIITYLIDILVRRHGLDINLAIRALAPPFWEDIDRMPKPEGDLNRALRLAYGSAMMNGPFTVVMANPDMMVGFTDRGKLRPMVVGECGDRLYISSEEAAIRAMEPNVESITMPAAGEPVIGRVAP
ncbi:MAG TPA: glutamine amidotransferase family protein [Methanoculleus sp.]|jgi:glutamate synthase domain-containing protein 1|nr:glutamine amidotransferase family protein [Methanoculleus sp.]MBP8676093.1 glutamine amidotransferase family protein [Methanoculleus sp.]HOB07340.1 glutamine amidotransferase family protein [Methanoculleus sp.]HOD85462.1 glutamine amidotransferase family protein [Methanoculleus sp.]HON41180.1 glutamine amidotransferase family protein [Methanoculleus sp.]